MDVTLGAVVLDGATTSVRERYEEVGGRDARHITLSGVVTGLPTMEALVARLDSILEGASASEQVPLSLRPGRRLLVRRAKCSREVLAQPLVGAFTLDLEATDPFEESTVETVVPWVVTQSGQTVSVAASGNVETLPRISLRADQAIISPSFEANGRTVAYSGQVPAGGTIVFDGREGKVMLDGVDVTAYASGVSLRLAPGNTVLRYSDAAASSHRATISVTFRDRWW